MNGDKLARFGALEAGVSFGTLGRFAGVFRRRPLIGSPTDLEGHFTASAVVRLRDHQLKS